MFTSILMRLFFYEAGIFLFCSTKYFLTVKDVHAHPVALMHLISFGFHICAAFAQKILLGAESANHHRQCPK